MISNILLEKRLSMKVDDKTELKDKELDFNKQKYALDYPLPGRIPETEAQFKTSNKLNDLHDFVFSGKDSTKELDQFYSVNFEEEDKKVAKDPEMNCALTCGNRTLSDNRCNKDNVDNCNSTPQTQEEVRGHYSNFNKVEEEGNIDQNKYFYLVNNYKDEKLINGGNMERTYNGDSLTTGPIMGFDMAEPTTFMEY